jgi:hypothetical protein
VVVFGHPRTRAGAPIRLILKILLFGLYRASWQA